MAFIFNGNVPENIIYNGQSLSTLVYNGDVVWTHKPLTTVSGIPPLTLTNAAGDPVNSLVAYGKCEQEGLPGTPMDIVCNNGALKFGKPMTINSTRIFAYINATGFWIASDDSYSVAIPVVTGKKYIISFTNTDSNTVGTIFRYGFSDTNTPTGQRLTQWVRTTPQDTPRVELTAGKSYLVIQMGSTVAGGNILNGYITLKEATIYVDGTVETIEIDTTGDIATCENLLSAGDYEDTQEVISGSVTRNVGIKVLDGTEDWRLSAVSSVFVLGISDSRKTEERLAIPSTHYVGTDATDANMPDDSIKFGPTTFTGWEAVGAISVKDTTYTTLNGFKQYLTGQYNAGTPVIIVYPLATPTTETVTGQPMTLQEGTNIVDITQASLDDLELEVTFS